jgi:hypothetical protein
MGLLGGSTRASYMIRHLPDYGDRLRMLVVLNRLDNWAGDERHRFCVNASGHFVEFF